MTNIREWLDQNYPKDQRRNIKELDISDNNLEGSLKLNQFDNLEKFCCSGNKITDLDVSNCKKLEKLDCSGNKLSNLVLRDLPNLKKLELSFNNLSNEGLITSNLKNLEEFHCSNNHLTELSHFFSNFGEKNKLTVLNIKNNNIFSCELSDFSKFANLKILWIGNDEEERIEKDVYNRFKGSLSSLQGLKKLESLNISNTDINLGLEYLSENLKWIYCLFEQRPKSKVKKLVKQLGSISLVDEDEGKYNFKKVNVKKIVKIVDMEDTKNIIIVGRTGSGKSTLVNVLLGEKKKTISNNESEYSVSKTSSCRAEYFSHEGDNYCVIDTPGIDNMQLSEEKILMEIKEGIDLVEGLSQIFLVVKDGSFIEGEREFFKLLASALGDKVTNLVTIVRTHFDSFKDKKKCVGDGEFLVRKITEFDKSFANCKFIYVSNPSIDVNGESDDDEKQKNELNKKDREYSRGLLIEHLKDNCQENYKLDSKKIIEVKPKANVEDNRKRKCLFL